jgi:hypothetical protein
MPQKKGTARKTLATVKRKSRTVVKKIGALEKTVLKDFKGAAWRTSTGIKKMWRSAENLASSKKKTARKKLASAR